MENDLKLHSATKCNPAFRQTFAINLVLLQLISKFRVFHGTKVIMSAEIHLERPIGSLNCFRVNCFNIFKVGTIFTVTMV